MQKAVRIGALLLALGWGYTVRAENVYTLKENEDKSVISKTVATSPIPFDKRYDELTDEQKRTIRESYSDLKSEDEPPYPKYGTGRIVRGIWNGTQIVYASGEMFATVKVDQHGKAQSVQVFETPDPAMSKLVAYVLMLSEYKPGKCDGKECTMDYPFAVKLGRD